MNIILTFISLKFGFYFLVDVVYRFQDFIPHQDLPERIFKVAVQVKRI
jgi:hypothetical protein